MGPAEISVPSAVENVIRDRYYYDVYMNDVHIRKITLPPGHHKRVTFAGGPCGADFHGFWHVGSDPERNHACQISNRSVRMFVGYLGPKSWVSHRL